MPRVYNQYYFVLCIELFKLSHPVAASYNLELPTL